MIISNMLSNNQNNQKGYIALILILIVLGITLMIAISANLLGISEGDMGLRKSQSSEAFYLANLCAEDALMKLKRNLGYSGNETLIVGEGSCNILPLEGSGNTNRIVKTTGNIYNQTRRIKIQVDMVNPKMKISSWQEVVNF